MDDNQLIDTGTGKTMTGTIEAKGLAGLSAIPMPDLKPPPWYVGETVPKHRVRFWLWSAFASVTQWIGFRFGDVSTWAFARSMDAGPQPIIDESKIPTKISFTWSDPNAGTDPGTD